MSKSSVGLWDTTADNNLDVGGIGLGEGVMTAPAVNNAIREMMAQIKDFYTGTQLRAVGQVAYFTLSSAPDGWLAADGKTIGGGSSTATARANIDMADLFKALWGAFSNTVLPIQDSSGTATTRGASATADFSANKRLPLPDLRGEFIRALDDGRGVDASRSLGSAQSDAFKSHDHTGTALSAGAHTHQIQPGRTSNFDNGAIANGRALSSPLLGRYSTESAGAHTHTLSINNTGGSETRPRNIALYACIKY